MTVPTMSRLHPYSRTLVIVRALVIVLPCYGALEIVGVIIIITMYFNKNSARQFPPPLFTRNCMERYLAKVTLLKLLLAYITLESRVYCEQISSGWVRRLPSNEGIKDGSLKRSLFNRLFYARQHVVLSAY